MKLYKIVGWKVKCSSESDYNRLKKALKKDGINFSRKEGKSLKVDCSRSELSDYLDELLIMPISIKPRKDTKVVVEYKTHNNLDEQGSVELKNHCKVIGNELDNPELLEQYEILIENEEPGEMEVQ